MNTSAPRPLACDVARGASPVTREDFPARDPRGRFSPAAQMGVIRAPVLWVDSESCKW